MAKAKRKRSPAKGEQKLIPELAPRRIERIHTAAKRYAEERDLRIQCNKDEKEAQEHLLAVMNELGLKEYEYGDLKVFVDAKTKVKVKLGGVDHTDGTEDGDGD